jgi:outer membrane protein OmpA-like peptidoglycan-associated protein
LVLGAVLVPASLTAVGFTVAGEELTSALSSSPAVPPPLSGPVPVADLVPPLRMQPPAPLLVPAAVAQRNVRDLFSSHAVKGVTFAPGTAALAGRGADVRRALAVVLRDLSGGAVTLVAHAWNGETASHRCDVLALERAALLRDYLASQGVDSVITTRVVVDPVWGPPSDAGPPIDVLVG